MIQAITVTPSVGGWTVKTDAVDEELFFRSGASAEAAARALGERMAGAGANVEVEIFLRDGSLAGKFAYPPA